MYYLVKNQEIIRSFLESENGIIKQFLMTLLAESVDFDEIQVYRVPFDVFVSEYPQVASYGTEVTCDFLDDDSSIIL